MFFYLNSPVFQIDGKNSLFSECKYAKIPVNTGFYAKILIFIILKLTFCEKMFGLKYKLVKNLNYKLV